MPERAPLCKPFAEKYPPRGRIFSIREPQLIEKFHGAVDSQKENATHSQIRTLMRMRMIRIQPLDALSPLGGGWGTLPLKDHFRRSSGFQ